MQKFRRGVPENSSVYICKNSLMREATKKVPGWETLADSGCTVSSRPLQLVLAQQLELAQEEDTYFVSRCLKYDVWKSESSRGPLLVCSKQSGPVHTVCW